MKPETGAASSSVPALVRGLQALRLLAQEGPLSLEAVRSRLDIPKSSAFRLLEALCEMQYAQRHPSGGYAATWELRPLREDAEGWSRRLDLVMRKLSNELGLAVEWWNATARGLALERQIIPKQAEVTVRARPGFLRQWKDELEAVTQLAYAFSPVAPELSVPLVMNKSDGIMGRLKLSEARKLIAAAQSSGAAADTFYNTNAVRRYAQAILLNGEFRGILSVAETFQFRNAPREPSPARALAVASQSFSS